jgi:hypothetical protein
MDSESGGGGKTTLFIVVFFLCVISAVVGYFQFTMSSQQAEAEKKMKDIQAKAEADMTAAKSDEEKREIQRKADLELEQAKMKVQTDAEKKALADREAKIKAAEAAVNKKLADAAATVKNAQNLQNQAKKVKADADKKNKDAAAAMAKAVASGKEVDKKLADEKKKLADDAKKKIDAANKAAADATTKATAEAKKALDLKAQLAQIDAKIKGAVFAEAAKYGAVPGYISKGYWKDVPAVRVGLSMRATNTPELCARAARREGSLAYGFRTSKHPDPKYRSTCFIYKRDNRVKYEGNGADEAHFTGCAFGGNPKSQCAGYPTVTVYDGTSYNGTSMSIAGIQDVAQIGGNLDNKISSVKVPANTVLYLYKDPNYQGTTQMISGPTNKTFGTFGFGNKASSLRLRYQ